MHPQHQKISQALGQFSLLSDLNDDERLYLARLLQQKHFSADDIVFERGDLSTSLYLIQNGNIEVLGGDSSSNKVLATLGAGLTFGEMNFIDETVRSATIRCVDDVTVFLLDQSQLQNTLAGEKIYYKIVLEVARTASDRLRDMSMFRLQGLERDLTSLKDKYRSANNFLTLLSAYAGAVLLNVLWSGDTHQGLISSDGPDRLFLLTLMMPIGIFIAWRRPSLRQIGLTPQVKWQPVVQGALIGLVAAIFLWMVVGIVDSLTNMVLRPATISLELLTRCVLFAFLEELFGRGLLQNTLQDFLEDKVGYRAIALGALLLSLLHLPFGLVPALYALITSALMGYLFVQARHHLIGVFLIHSAIIITLSSLGAL